MGDRELIFVAGPPSGGTFCVAGVLHRLGVDMGTFSDKPGIRGYVTYEDIGTGPYKVQPEDTREPLLEQRLRLREYAAMRLEGATGPVGVKGSALWWLLDDEPATLPVKVVLVTRPLSDVIASDFDKQAKIRRERPDMDRPPMTREWRIQRAGAVACAYQGAAEFYRELGAVMIDFYALRAERRLHVTALASALGLPTEGEQFQAAVQEVWQ